MIQTAESMVSEMPTLGETEFVMVDKKKLAEALKEWGETIVDTCMYALSPDDDENSEVAQELKDQL